MKWVNPFENEPINEERKKHILNSIDVRIIGSRTGFTIIWEK